MTDRTIFGLSAALVTPFAKDDTPDLPRLAGHAEWVLAHGCDSLTLFGTTGEGFSIGMRDRSAMLGAVLDAGIAPGRVNAAVAASAVADAADQALLALDAGAPHLLFTPPFYLKSPEEEGIYAWFSRAFEAIGPKLRGVILYHIPGQTAVPLSVGLVARLRKAFPDVIAGIKDSSGDWATTERFLAEHGDLAILVGDERLLARGYGEGRAGLDLRLRQLRPGDAEERDPRRRERAATGAPRRPRRLQSGDAGGQDAGCASPRRSGLCPYAAAAGRSRRGAGRGADA